MIAVLTSDGLALVFVGLGRLRVAPGEPECGVEDRSNFSIVYAGADTTRMMNLTLAARMTKTEACEVLRTIYDEMDHGHQCFDLAEVVTGVREFKGAHA